MRKPRNMSPSSTTLDNPRSDSGLPHSPRNAQHLAPTSSSSSSSSSPGSSARARADDDASSSSSSFSSSSAGSSARVRAHDDAFLVPGPDHLATASTLSRAIGPLGRRRRHRCHRRSPSSPPRERADLADLADSEPSSASAPSSASSSSSAPDIAIDADTEDDGAHPNSAAPPAPSTAARLRPRRPSAPLSFADAFAFIPPVSEASRAGLDVAEARRRGLRDDYFETRPRTHSSLPRRRRRTPIRVPRPSPASLHRARHSASPANDYDERTWRRVTASRRDHVVGHVRRFAQQCGTDRRAMVYECEVVGSALVAQVFQAVAHTLGVEMHTVFSAPVWKVQLVKRQGLIIAFSDTVVRNATMHAIDRLYPTEPPARPALVDLGNSTNGWHTTSDSDGSDGRSSSSTSAAGDGPSARAVPPLRDGASAGAPPITVVESSSDDAEVIEIEIQQARRSIAAQRHAAPRPDKIDELRERLTQELRAFAWTCNGVPGRMTCALTLVGGTASIVVMHRVASALGVRIEPQTALAPASVLLVKDDKHVVRWSDGNIARHVDGAILALRKLRDEVDDVDDVRSGGSDDVMCVGSVRRRNDANANDVDRSVRRRRFS